MKPNERLAEIEKLNNMTVTWNSSGIIYPAGIPKIEITWLIARVKKLTEVLEEISEYNGAALSGCNFASRARKALEEE